MAVNEFTPSGDSPRDSDDSPGIKSALLAAVEAQEAKDAEVEGIGGTDGVDAGKAVEVKAPEAKESKSPKSDDKADDGHPNSKSEKKSDDKTAKSTDEKSVDPKTTETGPPTNWSDKHKATFKALPKDGQEFLLERHRDMEADYTRKMQALAPLQAEYKAVDEIFAPNRDALKRANLTPSAVIHGWAQAEVALMSGDFNKQANLIAGVAKSYKLDPIKLATHILTQAGIADPQAALQQAAGVANEHLQRNPPPAPLPPEVLERLRKIDQFEAQHFQQQQRQMDDAASSIDNELTKFKTATDANGALLRPHFDDLIETMAHLVNEDSAARRPPRPIEQLYQDAIFANPAVRQKWLDAKLAAERSTVNTAQQAERDKQAAAARAKSAAARKAGSSVTGSSIGSGQAINGKDKSGASLRSILAAAVEEHENPLA